jgi:hypothetical protein
LAKHPFKKMSSQICPVLNFFGGECLGGLVYWATSLMILYKTVTSSVKICLGSFATAATLQN